MSPTAHAAPAVNIRVCSCDRLVRQGDTWSCRRCGQRYDCQLRESDRRRLLYHQLRSCIDGLAARVEREVGHGG
jgi:hypothetical protein